MTHAKNERIASNLRRLAEMVEQSPDEYSASIQALSATAIHRPQGSTSERDTC